MFIKLNVVEPINRFASIFFNNDDGGGGGNNPNPDGGGGAPNKPTGGGADPNGKGGQEDPGKGGKQPPSGGASKYEGKTAEELVQLLEASESQIGTLSQQASQAEQLEQLLYQVINQGQGDQGGQDPNDGKQMDLFSQEEAMELFKDPAKALNAIAQKLVEHAQQTTTKTLEEKGEATRRKQELRNSFYDTNKDLVGYESVVGYVANAVQRANPHLPLDKVMEKVAAETRSEINRIRGTQSQDPGTGEGGPGTGGGARNLQQEPSGQQKEISDLVGSRR